MCGWPPLLGVTNICSNPDCDLLSWNPDQTPAQLRAATPDVIDLDTWTVTHGHPTPEPPDIVA
jgi:hypothetical protein